MTVSIWAYFTLWRLDLDCRCFDRMLQPRPKDFLVPVRRLIWVMVQGSNLCVVESRYLHSLNNVNVKIVRYQSKAVIRVTDRLS